MPLRAMQLPEPNGNGALDAPVASLGPAIPALIPLLLSLDQAAILMGVSDRTLKRMAASGALPQGAVCRPFGRARLFNRPILERWVAEGCPPMRRRT
jgi:excisionase family DNA binding protein